MRGLCPTHVGAASLVAAKTNELNWSFDTDRDIRTQPAIDLDGTIYFGSDLDRLHALNADGSVKWQVEVGADVQSSPAIGANGLIYFGADDGRVYAVNRQGQIVHSFNTGLQVDSSPAIGPDGTVYVGSDDDHLYALNPNLTQRWRFRTGADVKSSPALGTNGLVYVGSDDDRVYALNATSGALVWSRRLSGDVKSSPALGRNGTVYVGSDDNRLYAINGTTGAIRWSFLTGGDVRSSPAIAADGSVSFGSDDDRVYTLVDNGASSTLKWAFHTGNDVQSSPAIGADGTVYVGSDSGKVYALNASSGQPIWTFSTGGIVRGSPAIGGNGSVYIGSDDDRLYSIGKSPIAIVTNFTFTPASAAPLLYVAPRADGGALASSTHEVFRIDPSGSSSVLFVGSLGPPRSRPVLNPSGTSFGIFVGFDFALHNDSGALLVNLPVRPLDYVKLVPSSQSVFFPEVEETRGEDGRTLAGRVFDSGGALTGTFAAPDLNVSRLTATHIYHSNQTQLIKTSLSGVEAWRASIGLQTFQVAATVDRVIGALSSNTQTVVHLNAGSEIARTTVAQPIWNLAISPGGAYSVATTQTTVHVFLDGVERGRTTLPVAFANSADVSDRGEVLIGGQQADHVTRLFLLSEFGSVLWEQAGGVDSNAWRPELRFVPGGEAFFARLNTGLVSYSIDRSP